MKTALVVMAAGIGSRYGGGIKQLEAVGPSGEIIMDYSIYDARRAGFDKVVFIIRREIEKDFREVIGDRVSKVMDVEYAYQELTDLPEGFNVPEGRKKPWGTGHAVLSVRDIVDCPFAVINADDYYGPESFRAVHDYMAGAMQTGTGRFDMCMAGFVLGNTLSDNGTVNRGICTLNADGTLADVRETYGIAEKDGVMYAEDGDGAPVSVAKDMFVSMNMWGLPPEFLKELEREFPRFLAETSGGGAKGEFMLPAVIDRCIKNGTGTVRVLPTNDTWFGVTYKEDKPAVMASVRELVAKGVYPEKLFQG